MSKMGEVERVHRMTADLQNLVEEEITTAVSTEAQIEDVILDESVYLVS